MKTKTQPGKNHYKIFPINSKQNKKKQSNSIWVLRPRFCRGIISKRSFT